MLAEETRWCNPWEVEDVVPALWADRFWAVHTARKRAREGPATVAPGQSTVQGNVKKTRLI